MELDYAQLSAARRLRSGSILWGGLGSGKSRTSLYYFFHYVCGGEIPVQGKTFKWCAPKKEVPLYIITTAKKRDSFEWEKELGCFRLKATIDSWNNITKYVGVKDSFFIFDEQRVVGSGTWVRSFLKIAELNHWILLTATPGDTWTDYIPVFIANGFYKNRTAFFNEHVVFARFVTYPKIERYVNCEKLLKYRDRVLVDIDYISPHKRNHHWYECWYSKEDYDIVKDDRWNIFENRPIKDASEWCQTLRKIVNSSGDRIVKVLKILEKRKKLVIFYNFNYELSILKNTLEECDIVYAEWNGHIHEYLPTGDSWCYLVQYNAGAEGWECTTSNTIVFYSLNYSYKTMEQASGRIDRRNTPYEYLHYYYLISDSSIDDAIEKCIRRKKEFNEIAFFDSQKKHAL